MEEQIDYPGSPNDVLSLRPLSTSRTEAGGRPSGYVEQGVHIDHSALRVEVPNREGLVGKQRRKSKPKSHSNILRVLWNGQLVSASRHPLLVSHKDVLPAKRALRPSYSRLQNALHPSFLGVLCPGLHFRHLVEAGRFNNE